MAKELPYFQFEPAEWKFGRIQKQSNKTKVAFMDLLCKYWHNSCEMSLEDAYLDFGKKEVNELISAKIIKVEGEKIQIDFLLNQIKKIENTSKKNSEKGKLSAAKKAEEKQQQLNSGSTVVQPNSTDKIREEEIKEDEIKLDKITQDQNLIEFYFNDLENCSDIQTIAMNNRVDVDWVKRQIPLFRAKAELSYPSFQRFTSHFKNFIHKEIEKKINGKQQGNQNSGKSNITGVVELAHKMLDPNNSDYDKTGS